MKNQCTHIFLNMSQVSFPVNEYLGNISLTDQWLFCTDLIYFKNFVQNSPVSVPEFCILNRPVGIETRGKDYQNFLTRSVVPFIAKKFPYRHGFFMDNDP